MGNVLADPSTSATLTGAIMTYYQKRLLTRLEIATVYHKFGLDSQLPGKGGGGPTIRWIVYTNFDADYAPLTEGINPSPSWLSNSYVEASLETFGAYVPIGDMLQRTAIDDVVKGAVDVLGYRAAKTVDLRIRNKLFGNDVEDENPSLDTAHLSTFWNGKQGGLSTLFLSGTGAALTYALLNSFISTDSSSFANTDFGMNLKRVRRVVRKLRGDGVQAWPDGLYRSIIDSRSAEQMMNDPEWQSMQQFTGRTNLEKGELGEVAGVKFFSNGAGGQLIGNFVTNTAPFSVGSTSVSAAFTPIFGMECYGVSGWKVGGGDRFAGIDIIIKTPNQNDTSNPLNMYSTVGYKVAFATRVLNRSKGYFLVTLQA